jgi:hypothetical protein
MTSAVERGTAWILDRLEPDGSLRDAPYLNAYYKAPFALMQSGRIQECERVLDYISQRFLLPSGDLEGAGVPWFDTYRTYPHSWLACAAICRGRFEISSPLIEFVSYYLDLAGQKDIMTASMAGLACLWAGRDRLARATGVSLEQVFDQQPDITRGLYHVWHTEEGLVLRDGVDHFVDASQPKQWYFNYGIAAAFLSALSASTADTRWLEAAQQYLRASRHCAEDRYSTPQSGKIGWGAAWTYRLSRDPNDLELVHAVSRGLEALQASDGSWQQSAYCDTFDVTNEFVALLGMMGVVDGVREQNQAAPR